MPRLLPNVSDERLLQSVLLLQEGDEVLFFQSPPKGSKERFFAPGITALVSVAKGVRVLTQPIFQLHSAQSSLRGGMLVWTGS